MSGSSVTELEIGPNYYTTRGLTPREAGLAEPPEAREESDEKKAITATVLSPPCSFGAAKNVSYVVNLTIKAEKEGVLDGVLGRMRKT